MCRYRKVCTHSSKLRFQQQTNVGVMLGRRPGRFKTLGRVTSPSQRTASTPAGTASTVSVCGTVVGTSLDARGITVLKLAAARRSGDAVQKSVFQVSVSGTQAAQLARLRPGFTAFCAGGLHLRPRFNPISLSYDYSHEISVSDQLGFASPVFLQRVAR